MNKRLLFLAGGIIFLYVSACTSKKKEYSESDGVIKDVAIKKVLVESIPGCKYDSMTCAQFEVSYPEFPGLDTAVQDVIRTKIAAILNDRSGGVKKTIEEQGNEFVKEFKEFKAETPDMNGRWYRNVSISLMTFNDSLLSLQIGDESFTGGAHGSYSTTFINVKARNGDSLKLSDFLKPGYEAPLKKIGEEIFRDVRELADTASFEFNGYSFPDNAFVLNENYGFKQEGIIFYYNSYEIAPYSMGPTELVIPFEKIRDWIK